MKKRKTTLIIALGLGIVLLLLLRGKPPLLPDFSERVLISLREPYTGELIVEKTISDPIAISALAKTFSSARSCSDHKCLPIGAISFITETEATTLKVLPGHNPRKYEFRLDGKMYRLSRDYYVDSLVAAGIDRDDIRLDEHPDIEQGSGGNSAALGASP